MRLTIILLALAGCTLKQPCSCPPNLSDEHELVQTIFNDIKARHCDWVVTENDIVINLRTGLMISWINDTTIQVNNKSGDVVYTIREYDTTMNSILETLKTKKLREKITFLVNTLKDE